MRTPGVQDHYPEDFSHCYGCGRLNAEGLHVRSVPEGEEWVARFTPKAAHIAVPGFVYGGLLASLVDCHAMGAASGAALRRAGGTLGKDPSPRYVTASLKVDYRRPTPLGPELELRAKVLDASEKKTRVAVEVLAAGQLTANGEVLAVPMPASMKPA
jgi:acyl-coenzyme A thioesterase PaaI-like protein